MLIHVLVTDFRNAKTMAHIIRYIGRVLSLVSLSIGREKMISELFKEQNILPKLLVELVNRVAISGSLCLNNSFKCESAILYGLKQTVYS